MTVSIDDCGSYDFTSGDCILQMRTEFTKEMVHKVIDYLLEWSFTSG